MDFVWLKSGGW